MKLYLFESALSSSQEVHYTAVRVDISFLGVVILSIKDFWGSVGLLTYNRVGKLILSALLVRNREVYYFYCSIF